MNTSEMITIIRRDLGDESAPCQWSDEELNRYLNRALSELSERLPLPVKTVLPTTPGSRELNITSLSSRVMVQAVEYPIDETPPKYKRFSIWGDTLNIISGPEPDGSSCAVYYGTLHTITAEGTTLPEKHYDLVATGAAAFAAISRAAATINKVNIGGKRSSEEYRTWSNERLIVFRERLRQLGRRQRIRSQQLFTE